MTTKKYRGSTLDSFLKEEGMLESVEAASIKSVIAFELQKAMKKSHVSKSDLAAKMHTSRAALDRLLDPNNTSITLITLIKAAHVLGKRLQVSLR